MSPIDSLSGIRGKRIPGRPGRFDPSEPLHMTTRRAAKGPTANGSPEYGSTGESDSRRGSFDDLRPVTSYSNGSQFSAKSRRHSEISVTAVTPDNNINGIYSSEEKQRSSGSDPKPLSPVQQSPSPSRKRKRSSSPPAQPAESLQPTTPQQPASIEDVSFESFNQAPTYEDDVDAVEVVERDDLSDREVPLSQASSQSEEPVPTNDETMAEQSMDITPAVSGPVSPATSESNSQENLPLAKPLEAALEQVVQSTQEEPDEQDDAMDGVEDADDGDDVDEQARSDEDLLPRRGRFGGRRRAKHHIPRVERAMARQSELKSAYRAIARAQKAILVEIAQRTVDDLENNPESHLQATEYESVKAGLDAEYEERRAAVQAQHDMNMEQLKLTLDSQQDVLRSNCRTQQQNMQDEQLDRLEYDILKIARAAQLEGFDAGYDTEDEDDVILRPKGMGYRWKRTKALDYVYDSRSRLALETERAHADLEKRYQMRKLLEALDEEDRPQDLGLFTVRDSTLREMATEKSESLQNTKTLAQAADEIERKSTIPVIRNEDAVGLQMLGDLASRPSITGSAPPPTREGTGSNSYIGQTPPRRMPPQLQLQTDHETNRIPVQMSPRTTQALGDRFDNSMLPPITPRQEASYVRSPDAMRTEYPPPSPSMSGHRSSWGQFPMKQSDSRPESRSELLSGSRSGRTDYPPHNEERRPDNSAAPFPFDDRRNDIPQWREYPGEQPYDRRSAAQGDRVPFGFPMRDERRSEQSFQDRKKDQDAVKHETSPSFNRLQSRPPPWADASSQPGASRDFDPMSPNEDLRGPSSVAARTPPLRASSATFSVHDFRLDNKGPRSTFPKKLNREDRGGLPRRHWSKEHRKPSGSEFRKPGPASAASPTTTSPSYANSPVDRATPLPPPPQHSPLGPPPPSAYGQAPYGQPPPPHYQSDSTNYDFYQHRNSFPPQPPASIWNQPSPSPLYAVPQQHAPPPGVPSEQYNRYGPPPPPGYQHPPAPHPPSASGSGSFQQFGGPTLAPATTNSGFHTPGFRPAQPLPAFAQQAQQQQSSFGQRRRTQSDTGFNKFQPWQPPSARR